MRRTLALAGIAAVAVSALLGLTRSSRKTAGTQDEDPDTDRAADAVPTARAFAAPADGGPGHAPTDLSGDRHPDGSEPVDDHYRPDPHAEVAPEDRESLRPVTVPIDRG